MKRTPILALVFAAVFLPLTGFAADGHNMSDGMTHAQQVSMQSMEGTVKKVNPDKGRISVAHPAMHGMPAMTMIYKLKDPSWAKQIKPGSHIRFETETMHGQSVIVTFKTR